MIGTSTRPSNKNQWQGAQADPKQKQDGTLKKMLHLLCALVKIKQQFPSLS
jgi:hypothetical protein